MSARTERAAALMALCLAALPPPAAAAQDCAEGRVATPATQGRCCWAGQSFSPALGRCVGPPQCPAGRAAAGDDCVIAAVASYAGPYPSGRPTRTARSPIWGLVAAGIVTFGVGWLGGPIVTAAVGGDGTEIGLFAVPLVGPWICLAACDDPDDYLPAIVADGIVQLAGLTMSILGLAINSEVQVSAELDDGVRLGVSPWAAPSSAPAAGALVTLVHD